MRLNTARTSSTTPLRATEPSPELDVGYPAFPGSGRMAVRKVPSRAGRDVPVSSVQQAGSSTEQHGEVTSSTGGSHDAFAPSTTHMRREVWI